MAAYVSSAPERTQAKIRGQATSAVTPADRCPCYGLKARPLTNLVIRDTFENWSTMVCEVETTRSNSFNRRPPIISNRDRVRRPTRVCPRPLPLSVLH